LLQLEIEVASGLIPVFVEEARNRDLQPEEQQALRAYINQAYPSAAVLTRKLIESPEFAADAANILDVLQRRLKPFPFEVSQRERNFWQSTLRAEGTAENLTGPQICRKLGIGFRDDMESRTWILSAYNFGLPTAVSGKDSYIITSIVHYEPQEDTVASVHHNELHAPLDAKGQHKVGDGVLCRISFQLAACFATRGVPAIAHYGQTDNLRIPFKFASQGWESINSNQYNLASKVPTFGYNCIDGLSKLKDGLAPDRLWSIDAQGNPQVFTTARAYTSCLGDVPYW